MRETPRYLQHRYRRSVATAIGDAAEDGGFGRTWQAVAFSSSPTVARQVFSAVLLADVERARRTVSQHRLGVNRPIGHFMRQLSPQEAQSVSSSSRTCGE